MLDPVLFKILVFAPLAGFLIAGLGGKWIGDRGAQIVTTGLLFLSAVCATLAFNSVALHHHVYDVTVTRWVSSGDLSFDWALRIDTLTAVMLVVVTYVSSLVHLYSIGYMSHDHSIPRFFAYLSLFTFAMLMLVTSRNLVQMFFGWEGVGVASYLLIGFWYQKPSANAAAIKAFIVNRVGDFGFTLGILAAFWLFGTLDMPDIFAAVPKMKDAHFAFLGVQVHALTCIAILLFIGACGKSAQLFLHTWLPDAMEGPTPVSALIHAATMVTAGVFLVCRASPIFEYAPDAKTIVAIVGGTTAFFAASVGLVQNDIKRVIAYSTCSQLGYMFLAAGCGAYGAAVFHLFTHAFFKALLFLSAGSVIHAMSNEQDMRYMGGIWKKIPFTYAAMIAGTLAITGVPGFAGYFSKDMIIESAYAASAGAAGSEAARYAFLISVTAALFTSFYSWRLIFMTFHGKPRASHEVMHHVHESPLVMTVPLALLALGAIFSGWLFHGYFIGEGYDGFWNGALTLAGSNIMHAAHEHTPAAVAWAPFAVMVLGFLIAFRMYVLKPGSAEALANSFQGLYRFLLNKWYFDELYDFLFVRPALALGRIFWKRGDGAIIDGLGPDGVSSLVARAALGLRKIQTGYVYHYAFAMLIGVAGIVTWFTIAGGSR